MKTAKKAAPLSAGEHLLLRGGGKSDLTLEALRTESTRILESISSLNSLDLSREVFSYDLDARKLHRDVVLDPNRLGEIVEMLGDHAVVVLVSIAAFVNRALSALPSKVELAVAELEHAKFLLQWTPSSFWFSQDDTPAEGAAQGANLPLTNPYHDLPNRVSREVSIESRRRRSRQASEAARIGQAPRERIKDLAFQYHLRQGPQASVAKSAAEFAGAANFHERVISQGTLVKHIYKMLRQKGIATPTKRGRKPKAAST